jgi:hypothetical protein
VFQVFHLNVTYVAMAIYACCKRMFHVASICLSVLGVLDVCFKCFIRMLQKYIRMLHNMHIANHMFQVFQVFRTYVVSVLHGCCICLQWLSNVFFGVYESVRHIL